MSQESSKKDRDLKGYVGVAARGFCMGAADVVPGVSGGTMAFILGIYEELIEAIHAVDATFIRRLLSFQFVKAFVGFPYKFLIALVGGIGVAIFSLARFFSWALTNYPEFVWSFFFGLVVASVLTVQKRVTWSGGFLGLAAVSAVAAYVLVGLVPVETTEALWFVFVSGAIAICAMILPGISGSFILLLLGKYQYVLSAVVERDFATLLVFSCGCGLGLLSFARLLRWLFHRFHDATVAALIGLMIGSLRKVWPWKETVETFLDRHGVAKPLVQMNILPETMGSDVLIAAGLAALGFLLVAGLERAARPGDSDSVSQ